MILDKLMFPMPDKPFKNEALFTTWFWSQISKSGGFFHKISDYSLWFKPFDAIFALDGLTWGIELKFTHNASCTPFTMLRWSCPKNPGTQVKSLTDYQNNGWNSLVIVYSAKKHKYVVVDFKDLSLTTKITF